MDGVVIGLIGLAIAAAIFAAAFVLPVVNLVRTSRALREIARANERIDALTRLVEDLTVADRRRTGGIEAPRQAADLTAEAVSVPVPPAAEGPERTASPAPPPVPEPAAATVMAASSLGGEPAVPADAPEPFGLPPDAVSALAPEPGAAGQPIVEPQASAHVEPHSPTLEQRIGQRWMLYAGIAAVVLGASYLVKLAFDNNWITPAMRVGLSAAGGMVLVGSGLRFADRGLAAFGHLLAGGGFAVLYVAVFAALHLYHLVGRPAAFGLMAGVTAMAAALADRRRAQGLAMVALAGGFATPFLVGGETGAVVELFTYVTVLVAGSTFLARRHAWPAVTLVAFVLTVFTFTAWAAVAQRSHRHLVVQAFLTAWLGLFLLAVLRPSKEEDSDDPPQAGAASRAAAGPLHGGVAVVVGLLAPLLYHLASLANLSRHALELLVYFIAATLAGILYSADGRRTWARLAIWVLVWLPMIGWLSDRGNVAGARVTLFAVFGLHLLSELRVLARDSERLEHLDALLLHLNGLGLVTGLLLFSPRWDTHAMALAAAGVGLFHGVLALAMRGRHDHAPLHYAALASACFAGALALRFEGAWVTLGWGVEGALLVWLGLIERRQWLRAGGAVLLAMAAWHGLELLGRPPGTHVVPFLNARALSETAIAGLLLWLARAYVTRGQDVKGGAHTAIAVCVISACTLLLFVFTSEINGVYGAFAWRLQTRSGPMAAGTADLARLMTLSIAWAAYAVVLVAIGIARRYAPIRYLAILVFAITMGKVFLVDLAELDRAYRILSVVGLGLLLIAASYLYQRFLADEGS